MSPDFTNRPTWAEINLDNLAYNFQSVKNFVGENLSYMAVVKADGYGHNAVQCALRLEKEGINWFGVALPEEGLELRNAGVTKPILCLGGFWFGQEEFIIKNDLTAVIYQLEKAESLNEKAKSLGVTAPAHIKIDTGMGRIGVRYDAVENFAEKVKQLHNLDIQGLMTHFAAADDLGENNFTELQINRFNEAVRIFEDKGFHLIYKDSANSPGAIAHPESPGNLVRLGGVLYGLGGDILPPTIPLPDLKPVMSIHTRIAHLKKVPKGETIGYSRTFQTDRDSLIATIPIGYQDGIPRALSNKGRVIIKNRYAPIVGRISMDWTIIDVTDVINVQLEDEVFIIGRNSDLTILTEEVSKLSGTISYEITCGINRRVVRKYVGSK